MAHSWQRRSLALIAVIAIVAALAVLLVPHGHSGNIGVWFAILPVVFFVGVLAPFGLFLPAATRDFGRGIDEPLLAASFQRPPPFRRG